MNAKIAYKAMYAYLAEHYKRTKSDDIGTLLGELSSLADNESADPAAWQDWAKAYEKASTGSVDTNLKISD